MSTRVALVVAVLLSTAAAAAQSSAAVRVSPPKVIKLLSTTTSAHFTDKPPKGQSAGDSLVATSRLQNAVRQFGKPRGAIVGGDSEKVTFQSKQSQLSDGVATLPGGTIHFRGHARDTSAGTVLPVVGGTGLYKGVTGTLTITDLDPVHAVNVYRLHTALVA